MQIGWCGRIEQADVTKAAGYDFLEVQLVPMNLEDDRRFAAAKDVVREAEFPQPIFNQFLPKTMRVVGPDVDESRIRRYLHRVAEVVSLAGGQLVVFGSGWTRNVPEGWSRPSAMTQFSEMVSWAVDAFAGTDIVLALESQNTTETNFMTTLAESVEIATAIHHPKVKVISDMYHLYMASEPLSVVTDSKDWIVHVHLSDSERRTPGTGRYDFDGYFRTLRAMNYRGHMSVEIMTDVDEGEMRRSVDWVRRHWEQAGPSS